MIMTIKGGTRKNKGGSPSILLVDRNFTDSDLKFILYSNLFTVCTVCGVLEVCKLMYICSGVRRCRYACGIDVMDVLRYRGNVSI